MDVTVVVDDIMLVDVVVAVLVAVLVMVNVEK